MATSEPHTTNTDHLRAQVSGCSEPFEPISPAIDVSPSRCIMSLVDVSLRTPYNIRALPSLELASCWSFRTRSVRFATLWPEQTYITVYGPCRVRIAGNGGHSHFMRHRRVVLALRFAPILRWSRRWSALSTRPTYQAGLEATDTPSTLVVVLFVALRGSTAGRCLR